LTGTVGRDQYALKVQRLRENSYFKDVDFDNFSANDRDETGLPKLFLEPLYVTMIKDNYSRIQKAFDRDPTVEPNFRISLEMYETLQSEHIELERRYEDLKATFGETEAESTEKLQSLNAELAKVKSSFAAAEEELLKLRKSKVALDDELDTTTQSLKQLGSKHTALETSYSEVTSSLQQLRGSHEELKQKEKQLTAQVANVTKEKEKAEAGINKMNRELFNFTKEIEKKEAEVKQSQKEQEKLQKQFQKVQDSEKALKQNIAETNRVGDTLKKNVKELEQRLASKTSELINHHDSFRELQASYDELDTLKDTLISKLQSAAAQIESYKSSQAQLDAKLENAVKELSQLEDLRMDNKTLKAQLNDRLINGEEAAEDKVKLQELQLANENMEKRLKELSAEPDHSNVGLHTADELNQLREELVKAREEAADRAKIIEDEKSTQVTLSEKHSEELANLKAKLSELELRLESANNDKETLQKSLRSAVENSAEAGKEVQTRVKELEQLKITHSNEIKESEKAHKGDMDDMVLMLTGLDEKKMKYKKRLAALGESVSEFEEDSEVSEDSSGEDSGDLDGSEDDEID
jgi:chromosome segregation ATPase